MMAGQATGGVPSPLQIRTGVPAPWFRHAITRVPSALTTSKRGTRASWHRRLPGSVTDCGGP
jgi:hypothetical protein